MEKPHPHVMMVPLPVQGHVIPLLELAQCLAKHGIRITFVNTDIIHDRIINSLSGEEKDAIDNRIRLVSVSDELKPGERSIPGKLTEMVYKMMPRKIEELIREIDFAEGEDGKISCVVYDQGLGGVCEIAKKLGVGTAAFSPAAAALVVLSFNIPKLIEDGIVDHQGTPLKHQIIQFAPTMPMISPSDFVWNRLQILAVEKQMFNIMTQNNEPTLSADRLICNSTHDLEPGAFALAPQIIPIGPLLASNRLGHSSGHFWPHDPSCLKWLDHHPPGSVIYIAFGSSTIFNKPQFQELALGLENSNRPFLWVVRPENRELLDQVSLTRGRVISWAPQQKVLSHASIACFVSHCGWNSTVESVSNGIPIMCWPYFADQFINQSYICDVWKVGLKFEKDNNGIVTCDEITRKINQLLDEDGMFKERALYFKGLISSGAREGGDSYKNLRSFISWIKGSD
ncbi:UDP-glycosyltransferase 83a1 [Phtheirospermum japonicum]|uniref:Glycosyltransferase n=1 Tax=Phtheirospermum japonicum TaxID=374723 RepID=A0A830BWN8_9LAMI|nr:UDP-glycosyltransferase 83a1 [Phtheirospermum japonicum]